MKSNKEMLSTSKGGFQFIPVGQTCSQWKITEAVLILTQAVQY